MAETALQANRWRWEPPGVEEEAAAPTYCRLRVVVFTGFMEAACRHYVANARRFVHRHARDHTRREDNDYPTYHDAI